MVLASDLVVLLFCQGLYKISLFMQGKGVSIMRNDPC